MLPAGIRARLFDRLSVKTMRYVSSVPTNDAKGLVARVYDMVAEDAFINGSITSHSRVPELMAGMWAVGREGVLVSDFLDRTTKEAMSATLSQVNDCPYCADMLISLVDGSGEHHVASAIFAKNEEQIPDGLMRNRCAWIRAVATAGPDERLESPFTRQELPEALCTLLVFSYINRFSHVVMDGSPVGAPLGLQGVKRTALRMFGFELRSTTARPLEPGRAVGLLPPAPLPDDLSWAAANPRIADALARWAAAVERETPRSVSLPVRELLERSLERWEGERMSLSRSWVDAEVAGLPGADRALARLALVVAKASHQVDDALVEDVLKDDPDEQRLIRVLAWASFSAARRIANRYYQHSKRIEAIPLES